MSRINKSTPVIKTIALPNENASLALGAWLFGHLAVGDVVLLHGDLGAGKTTLARGLIQSALGSVDVPSPTYTLVQTYDMPTFTLWHFDLFRLKSEDEVWELDIEDALETGVCLIEWPQRIAGLINGTELMIELSTDGDTRLALFRGDAPWAARLDKHNMKDEA